MLTEEPRIFFLHFWANDDALNLPAACAPPSTKPQALGADFARGLKFHCGWRVGRRAARGWRILLRHAR